MKEEKNSAYEGKIFLFSEELPLFESIEHNGTLGDMDLIPLVFIGFSAALAPALLAFQRSGPPPEMGDFALRATNLRSWMAAEAKPLHPRY